MENRRRYVNFFILMLLFVSTSIGYAQEFELIRERIANEVASEIGGALMAVGGAFLTLAVLGTFTLNITNGRGWVAIALVIFARWRIWPAVLGALLFAVVDAAQLQLAITSTLAGVPRELLIALPYLVVIIALAIAGRGLRYPGAYLKPYRRP